MRLMQLLRSILFTGGFFLSTAIYAVVVITIAWVLPFNGRWAIARSWAQLNLWLLKALCDLDFVVEGHDNIPAGCHVAMWKHASTWETIAQAFVFPAQAWVLKRELMWIPILGWALRMFQPIAIDRSAGSGAVRQVISQGKQRLNTGRWIVIFPEGTRTAVGETRKYGVSGAILAVEAGCKVVPVAHTAGYFWPRRGWLKKPGTIRVIIGAPIDTAGREPREITAEVQDWIEQTTAEAKP
ncbi:MAG: lysophospholipid acyltransferase family protein [Steroidobacteraceae bacterium]